MQGKTVWAKPLGVLQANVAKNRPALVPLSHWLGAACGKQPQNKCSDGVQCITCPGTCSSVRHLLVAATPGPRHLDMHPISP